VRLGATGFDFRPWFPLLLGKLPLRCGYEFAELVYGTIVGLVDAGQGEENEIAVLRVCCLTFGLRERILSKFGLSEGTVGRMEEIIREYRSKVSDDNVRSFFEDSQSYERYIARLSS
jgi:hypothetical protein